VGDGDPRDRTRGPGEGYGVLKGKTTGDEPTVTPWALGERGGVVVLMKEGGEGNLIEGNRVGEADDSDDCVTA
jgi:hypothetical protein